MNYIPLALITLGLMPASLVAQGAKITDPNAVLEIDFERTIPEVITYNSEHAYSPALAEPGEFHLENEGSMRLNSLSFSVQNPGRDIGRGEGEPSLYGDDLDGNGTSAERLKVGGGLAFIRGSGEKAAAILPEGGTALMIGTWRGSPHQTYFNTTLRVQNHTGAPLTQWAVQADIWFADEDMTPASLELAYSTDGETFTPLGSLTSMNTAPEDEFDPSNSAHWSEQKMLGGQFNATVAPMDYLYIRFKRGEEQGSAADFVIDNIQLQGQP